jgi:hypothetical protein
LRKGPGGASAGIYVMTEVETVSEMFVLLNNGKWTKSKNSVLCNVINKQDLR